MTAACRRKVLMRAMICWLCGPLALGLATSVCRCAANEAARDALAPVHRYPLDEAIKEPSGLALAGAALWVVSDKKAKVFNVTRYGILVTGATIDVREADEPNFEAVAVAGDTLLIASEATGEILQADAKTGVLVTRLPVADVAGNNGIEGLFARADGSIWALKEKDPSALIRLSPDGHEVSRTTLTFALDVSDLTGLGAADCPEQFLAVSQQSRTVYQFDETGEVLGQWPVVAARPEGIAYDQQTLFIADEQTAELLVFDFQGGCR